MSLEQLLEEYIKISNGDDSYNRYFIIGEDRCAATAKYIFGVKTKYLIIDILKRINDVRGVKDFVLNHSARLCFDSEVVATVIFKYLSNNITDEQAYFDYANYILQNYTFPAWQNDAEKIKSLASTKQFEAALEIIKKLAR